MPNASGLSGRLTQGLSMPMHLIGFGAFTTPSAADETFDPAKKSANITLSSGNLVATNTSGAGWYTALGLTGRSSGKYYFELKVEAVATEAYFMFGFATVPASSYDNFIGGGGYGGTAMGLQGDLSIYRTGTSAGSGSVGVNLALNDVVGIALDMDNGEAWVSQNNTYGASQNPATRTNPHTTFTPGATFYPACSFTGGDTNNKTRLLAGSNLTYSPPSGYVTW